MKKRVVVWGTGVVGSMVIAEILDHPVFELVGVGVTRSERAGQDVGTLLGLPETGIVTTTSVEELVALRPDALVHYGPTAAHADDNIRVITAFLRAGIDVCSTAMTPWVWPEMKQVPDAWRDPVTQACEEGGASCFTTGIDPGFANDLFPMTLMGLCGRVDSVRASELLDYTDYEGDYEDEMGIGRPPAYTPLLEIPDLLVMAWGATVPMIAHAAGIELDDITTTWEKWVTPTDRPTAKGVIEAGNVAAIRFTINGVHDGREVITLWGHFDLGDEKAPFRAMAGPVYRMVIDLADVNHAQWVLDTGASGWPGSPHYGDQFKLWKTGQLAPMLFDAKELHSAAEGDLELDP